MSSTERNHHSSKENAYEIIVIPSGDAASTKSIKVLRSNIILGSIAIVLLIMLGTAVLMLYTPVNNYIPISEEQLAHRYGGQLVDVQHKLISLSEEVLILREYNRKLRLALGQNASSDSSFADLSQQVEQDPTPAESYAAEEEISKKTGTQERITYRSVSFVKEFSYKPNFPIVVPVAGYVSRAFQSENGHIGIDFAGKIGSLIVAPADGYIIFAGWTPDDGFTLVMAHGNGYATVYKHNQSILRKVGEFVKRGEVIALLGNSGITSYGPHLHFEVWKDGQSQNPNEYFIASTL